MLALLFFGTEFILDCSEGFGTGGPCKALKPNGMGKNESGNYRDTVIHRDLSHTLSLAPHVTSHSLVYRS